MGTIQIDGSTPKITVGNATAEDATILFDGNAQDFYIALDDSADDLLIGLGSTVGTTPAIAIDENLKVNIPVTTASTSASTGSLTTGGGAGIGADLYVGDDAYLITDSAVLGFGADKDTTLTHTDGTGLTLNSTNKLCFNDASQFVQGSSATVLSIGATDEIDLTATAVDLNGTLNVSGVATFQATPVFPDGSLALADLDIDGGTDIGADIVDADLFIIDDGAGGTNRKTTASRLKTYLPGTWVPIDTFAATAATAIQRNGVFSSTYLNYVLVVSLVRFAADASLSIRLGVGGSIDSSANYRHTINALQNDNSGSTNYSDGNTNQIKLIYDVDADSEAGASGTFYFINPYGSFQRKMIYGYGTNSKGTAANTTTYTTAGTYHNSTTQNFTDISLMSDGGSNNFAAGSTVGGYGMFQLYGIVNS